MHEGVGDEPPDLPTAVGVVGDLRTQRFHRFFALGVLGVAVDHVIDPDGDLWIISSTLHARKFVSGMLATAITIQCSIVLS
jgi:hypothetical protein